jgi:two-component system NtrC family response regulator
LSQGQALLKEDEDIRIVLLGLYLPEGKCTEYIKDFLITPSQPQVIVITAHGDPDSAAEVIEEGAWDYLEKPISIPTLRLVLQRALLFQQEQNQQISLNRLQQEDLVGSSPCFLNCLERLARVAGSKSNVLLMGETGTGKELFATAIHNCSQRASQPFVTVDCASLPENLVESLLQGHTKGSFTGAHASKTGLIKQADGGTLFLDEISELPMSVQKGFLRILQERTIRPLGSPREESSDFRLIAASNRDIKEMVVKGEFRQDLYYRLYTNLITLPPLRERMEDIEPLTRKFLARACQEYGIDEKALSKDYLKVLQQYDWPGNVRELINVVFASVDSALNAPKLLPQHLPVDIRAKALKTTMLQSNGPAPEAIEQDEAGCLGVIPENGGQLPPLKEVRNQALNHVEARYMRKVIEKSGGNVKEACRIAEISRPRFYELLKKHSIDHRASSPDVS